MRVLVTGAGGFVGRHLRRSALPASWDVIAGYHRRFDTAGTGDEQVALDLRDGPGLRGAIAALAPDCIIHLAGRTFVPESLEDPIGTFEINTIATLHLLEAVRELRRGRTTYDPTVLLVASSEIYGHAAPERMPLDEQAPLDPRNPYAASKAAVALLGRQYAATAGMRVVTAVPFNHIGSGQSERFVVSSFAKQLAEIAQGRSPAVISVGNLEAKRDFTDVRDVVRAYVLLVERGVAGEWYNVASGEAVAIREILDRLIAISGLEVAVEPDPSRMRPSDIPIFAGSAQKLRSLGWEPSCPLQESLEDIWDHLLTLPGRRLEGASLPSRGP